MDKVFLFTRPGQQYHFGGFNNFESNVLEECDTHLHSDLLFSALVDTCSSVYPNLTEDLVSEFENGRIKLSSAFWFIEKDNIKICFYPKPVSCELFRTDDHKKFKKVKYVSEGIIKQGITPDLWNVECSLSGTFLCTKSELKKLGFEDMPGLYKTIILPKVKVHTDSVEDRLFQQTNIQVNDLDVPGTSTGFWFFLDTPSNDSPMYKIITPLLRILADSGLGGQRSTGTGKIHAITKSDIDDIEINTGEPVMTLGLLSPGQNDTDDMLYYTLLTRGGKYSGTKQRLMLLNMAAEGSILKRVLEGNIVNLQKSKMKTSLRYGNPLQVNINKKFLPSWS
ncbi:MAG: type III-A CRISPR-associated RAMP protein Csm4 [Bacteroidales bacterium]|nr:type III-A CRISPR-associated RAMP protein Csm4 [Bacteroidales bacterium]